MARTLKEEHLWKCLFVACRSPRVRDGSVVYSFLNPLLSERDHKTYQRNVYSYEAVERNDSADTSALSAMLLPMLKKLLEETLQPLMKSWLQQHLGNGKRTTLGKRRTGKRSSDRLTKRTVDTRQRQKTGRRFHARPGSRIQEEGRQCRE